MHGFPVGEENDPQVPSASLRDPTPALNATILLNELLFRIGSDPEDPLIGDRDAVGA